MRVRAFRRLWYTTALSSLGDWLGLLAVMAMATSLVTGYAEKNYALGGVLVVKILPAAVLGPLAGVFADRFDRRRTMIIGDGLRFVLFASIPLAALFVSADRTLAWLMIASFLTECVSLFWMPAKDAAMPNLVRRDQIEAANQWSLVTTYGLTPIAGGGLFAVLSVITGALATHLDFFKTAPATLALYFNAATFLVGAVIVVFIPEITGHRDGRPAHDGPGILAQMREAATFVVSSKLAGGLIIGLVGAFVAAGAVIGASKIFVTSLGGGDVAFGVLFGAVFLGLGLGMAVGPRIARELSRRRLFGLSIAFAAVCLMIAAVMPYIALAVIFVVGLGFGAGVAYLAGYTLMGTDVEDEIRGRVFAVLQSLIKIVLVLALAAVPFVVAQVGQESIHLGHVTYVVDGTRIVLVGAGLLSLFAGLLAYRRMDEREQVGVWTDLTSALRGDSSARRRMRGGGLFIAFEGGEGSGKSTQARLLAETLSAAGRCVVQTYEPGATAAGARIRQLLLHGDEPPTPRAEALLFAADRAHHVDTVIRPALDVGKVVITDRFVDSSLAYQGVGRQLAMDEVRRLSRWATGGLRPDLTILLDLPSELGLARAHGRSDADRFERESLEFHERVREAFRALAEAEPRRYLVLDASEPTERLAAAVATAVTSLLGPRRRFAAEVTTT